MGVFETAVAIVAIVMVTGVVRELIKRNQVDDSEAFEALKARAKIGSVRRADANRRSHRDGQKRILKTRN